MHMYSSILQNCGINPQSNSWLHVEPDSWPGSGVANYESLFKIHNLRIIKIMTVGKATFTTPCTQ